MSVHTALRSRAAIISVVVGLLMLVVKWTAFVLTGSQAVLADAFESVVHVGATLVMWWCLRVANEPPDAQHPYGHGSAESLSVAFEGGMVAMTGLAVWWTVGQGFRQGHTVSEPGLGVALTAAAAVVNVVLGSWLVATGRRTRSTILVADGHHVLSDVWTSGGAVLGLALVWWTGLAWIDGVTAVLLALIVVGVGLHLVRQAVVSLMDTADPRLLAEVVAELNRLRDPEWLDCHNLRLRTTGDRVYIDLHLVVPAGWTVARAHQTSEAIEAGVLARLRRQGAVFVHLDHPERPEYQGLTQTGGTWPLTIEAATRMEADHGESALV